MSFNYSAFANSVYLGVGKQYRFAPSGIKNDEWRLGLEKTAKGLIDTFDQNGDGQLSFDEFCTKESDAQARMELANQTGKTYEQLTPHEKAKFHQRVLALKQENINKNSATYNALNVNGGATLDARELANELSLLDANDYGGRDGAIGSEANSELYKFDPQTLNETARGNYVRNQFGNLCRPGDINPNRIRPGVSEALDNYNALEAEASVDELEGNDDSFLGNVGTILGGLVGLSLISDGCYYPNYCYGNQFGPYYPMATTCRCGGYNPYGSYPVMPYYGGYTSYVECNPYAGYNYDMGWQVGQMVGQGVVNFILNTLR